MLTLKPNFQPYEKKSRKQNKAKLKLHFQIFLCEKSSAKTRERKIRG